MSNFEVRFRDAKIALLHNSDRRARLHRATDDSGQNEAERSNACIGDALVDGGASKWEYYEQLTMALRKKIERECQQKR